MKAKFNVCGIVVCRDAKYAGEKLHVKGVKREVREKIDQNQENKFKKELRLKKFNRNTIFS